MNKIKVDIKIVQQSNEKTIKTIITQFELDPATTIKQIYSMVLEQYQFPDNRNEWSCYSETMRQYYNDIHASIGNIYDKIKLKINLAKMENENENADLVVQTEIKNLEQSFKANVTINQGNKKITDPVDIMINETLTLKEFFQYLQEYHKLAGDIRKWTCYSKKNDCFYDELNNKIVDFQDDNLTVNINEDCEAQELKNQKELILNLEVVNNKEEQLSFNLQINDQITVEEIYNFIKGQLNIQANIYNWTCYSKASNYYLQDMNFLVGQQFERDTFLINIAPDAKLRIQKVQEFQMKKDELTFCKDHPNSPIQLICTEKHQCQRKLCILCQQDHRHKAINKENITPIESLVQQIYEEANQFQIQKNYCSSLKKRLKHFEQLVQETITSYIQNVDNALQTYNDSFIIAEQILEKLQNQNFWLDQNLFIQEMIYITQSHYLQKQGVVNQINFQTIEQNILKCEDYLKQFQKTIFNLDFITIPQYKCIINLDKQNQFIKYQEKYLNQLFIEDGDYGKYLVSQSDFKLEIYDDFLTLLCTLSYESNADSTQMDIIQYVQDQLKLPKGIQIQTLQSELKNIKFSKSKEKQKIYLLINQDVIKIVINLSENDQIQFLDLKITIFNEQTTNTLQQTLNSQCTLQDIQDLIFRVCKFRNPNGKEIHFKIFDQIYYSHEKWNKTLEQLQIQTNTEIQVFVKNKNEEKIQFSEIQYCRNVNFKEDLITLKCDVLDGNKKNTILMQKNPQNSVEDLVKSLIYYCRINQNYQSLDLFIDKQPFNSRSQRNQTLQELRLTNTTAVVGKIRWLGG